MFQGMCIQYNLKNIKIGLMNSDYDLIWLNINECNVFGFHGTSNRSDKKMGYHNYLFVYLQLNLAAAWFNCIKIGL